MFMGAAKKARPEVEPETLEEEFLEKICTQHSVAVDLTEKNAPQQAFDYGTEEWDEFHGHARNTIESRNQQLKASGDEDIETGGRRRVRGLAAAQMIVTILLVNFNLRKIAAFLNDQARDEARTTPKPRTARRRDRVWANRYIATTGNGDLTSPGQPAPPHSAKPIPCPPQSRTRCGRKTHRARHQPARGQRTRAHTENPARPETGRAAVVSPPARESEQL